MTLEDKVNKIVGEIMTSNISSLHGVVRSALIEQDFDTKNYCADLIEKRLREFCDRSGSIFESMQHHSLYLVMFELREPSKK